MVTDQIADLLTRIRNAQKVGHPFVKVPASKTKERILQLLEREGFVAKVTSEKDDNDKPVLKVGLKYDSAGGPVIRDLKRISSPGKRQYVPCSDIPKVRGGLGLVVVSTSRGMLSDREARKEGVGGELVCSVY
ncbi:MAG TPA: 30S ribosomal protein S8 [Oligoflexia bacterium]|nr:30S ribosomal protein S8 [Oligoflexia bacterium]HMP49192.1 30S ribosomal protein S8 [Oligoflexia bacterium]